MACTACTKGKAVEGKAADSTEKGSISPRPPQPTQQPRKWGFFCVINSPRITHTTPANNAPRETPPPHTSPHLSHFKEKTGCFAGTAKHFLRREKPVFFHDFFDFSGFCCILVVCFKSKRLFIFITRGARNNQHHPPPARQSEREIYKANPDNVCVRLFHWRGKPFLIE